MEHPSPSTGVNNFSTTTQQSASFELEEKNEEPAPRTDHPCGFNITHQTISTNYLHPKYQYFPRYHPSDNASIPPKPEILWQKIDDELYLLFMTNLSKTLREVARKVALGKLLIFLAIIVLIVGIFITGHIPLIDALAGGAIMNGSAISWLVFYIVTILVLLLLSSHIDCSASSSLNHSVREFQGRFCDHGISSKMIEYTFQIGGGDYKNIYTSRYIVFSDVSCQTFHYELPRGGNERVGDSLDR